MSFGSSVLAAPDLFPARRAGETWGERVLYLELGGVALRLRGLTPQQEAAVRRRYGALCRDAEGDGREAAVPIDVFRADHRDFLPAAAGEELPLELGHQSSEIRLASRDFMARLELGRAPSGSLWTPASDLDGFLGALENFARVVVAYRLLARGGLLLHSSGVVDGAGSAHLFAGCSGAGKTTIARLSLTAGRELLSDDINVVVPSDDGRYVAERLPFAGELAPSPAATAAHFPVAGVYLLRQGDRHRLDRLPAPRAVAGLIACVPFVNADPHRLDEALQHLDRIVAAVPVAVLTFRRDSDFWGMLSTIPEAGRSGRGSGPLPGHAPGLDRGRKG